MGAGTRKARQEEAGIGKPSWKKTPPRRRRQMRRASATLHPPSGSSPSARPAVRQVRLLSRENLRDVGRYLLLACLVAAVCMGMIGLLRLPELTVTSTSTQIGGAVRLNPVEVYARSGLEGRNVLLIRPSEVAEQVSQLAGVEAAKVHVRLPNQVIIDVWERTPLVAWQGITTTLWLASDGAEVPQAGIPPPLTLIDRTGMALGDSRKLWPLVLANLADLNRAQPDVHEVFYGQLEGLFFLTPEGTAVWLGDSGSIETKLELYSASAQEIAGLGRTAQVIDVRFSDRRAMWW